MNFRFTHKMWQCFVVFLCIGIQTVSSGQDLADRTGVGSSGKIAESNKLEYNGAIQMSFAYCSPGVFTMGSSNGDSNGEIDETSWEAEIDAGFWISRHEVTQKQWLKVVGESPWEGQKYVCRSKDSPATYISYFDAIRFCRNLSIIEREAERLPASSRFRLPNEVEWEFACRAGNDSRFCFGDDSDQLHKYGWFDLLQVEPEPESISPQPIGTKMPSTWGIFDMHGNVFEWCSDWYFEHPLAPANSKLEPVFKVRRGGGWCSPASQCRSSYRDWGDPFEGTDDTGFRIVLEVGERSKVPGTDMGE